MNPDAHGTLVVPSGAVHAWSAYGDPFGERLVVLHGAGRAAEHYGALATVLARRFRVYVVDRPGRGRASPLPATAVAEQVIGDLRAVLHHLDTPWVFGHSGGARLALEVALTDPPRALAVYEPPLRLLPDWEEAFVRAVRAGRRGEAMRRFLRGLQLAPPGPWPDWAIETVAWFAIRGEKGDAYWKLVETLPYELELNHQLDGNPARWSTLRVPTLLLGGGASPAWLRESVEALAAAIPGARCVWIPGESHNAPDLTAPGTVGQAVLEAFAAVGP